MIKNCAVFKALVRARRYASNDVTDLQQTIWRLRQMNGDLECLDKLEQAALNYEACLKDSIKHLVEIG